MKSYQHGSRRKLGVVTDIFKLFFHPIRKCNKKFGDKQRNGRKTHVEKD